ncbi:MAG: glycosyltransferase [Hyphomicrobium sp.]
MLAERAKVDVAAFDGVICVGGEDWWYHNRGHFDFQIMRRLAKRRPVLFVNSVAVRMPSLREGGQFAARISRKLRSLTRGLAHVENHFWVFSPLVAPGPGGQAVSGWALAPQIRIAAARVGIRQPLLWIHCPAGARLIDELPHQALALQRTDRFETFPEADPDVVGRQIAALKARADLVVYCNAELMAEERSSVRRQLFVSHGVDFEMFAAAGEGSAKEPDDVAALPRPRVGFIGGIDAHTFAPELLLETAKRLPDVTFVLIGGCSLPDGWCRHENVKLLGRKPYEEVARYMAAMNALIMPWNGSDWIRACSPIKLKEYLAVGRPIVTTGFPALAPYLDLVRTASNADQFAAALGLALSEPYNAVAARYRVATEGWDAKADLVEDALLSIGRVSPVLHSTPADPIRPAA